MKILLVDDDTALRNLYTIAIDNFFQNEIEVVESASGNMAIDYLETDKTFHLIVSDYEMEDGTGGDLYSFVQEKRIRVPFLLVSSRTLEEMGDLGDFAEKKRINFYLQKPVKPQALVHQIKDILHTSVLADEHPDYKKIRIVFFLRFNKVLCDVFLKISTEKYLKIFNRGDTYSYEDVSKYISREIKYLYIKSRDYDEFCVSFAYTPFLVEDDSLPAEKVEDGIILSTKVIHELVLSVGISPLVIDLVDKSCKQIEKIITTEKKIYSYLYKVRQQKNYLFDHSYLVAYMSTTLAMNMEWFTQEMREKLIFASLLHDASIDDPEVAYAMDLNLPILEKIPPKILMKHKNHVDVMCDAVRDCSKIPPNVDWIIYRHHENPEGTGYPSGLSADEVTPLEAIFILSHNFINEIYRSNFNEDAKSLILIDLKKRFSVGKYHEVAEHLFHIFSKITD